jgi:plasmid stabilization system protein ParE
MALIQWSPDARFGLSGIIGRIRVSDPRTAEKWLSRIERLIETLERLPEIGSPVEEEPSLGLRELIVGPYRIIYKYDQPTDVCRIRYVVDGRRDVRRMLMPDEPS